MKLKEIRDGIFMFKCPGCKDTHSIPVKKGIANFKIWWDFNNDLNHPTLNPSILVTWEEGENYIPHRCHSFIRNGFIQFLDDCTHELKGQTIELEDFNDESNLTIKNEE